MSARWTERQLRAKYEVLLPLLDERSRRLVLGADAQTIGLGGIAVVARTAGMDTKTVTAGLDELDSGAEPLPPGRVRRAGAGRPCLEESDPGLVPALLELVEPARRGDPLG